MSASDASSDAFRRLLYERIPSSGLSRQPDKHLENDPSHRFLLLSPIWGLGLTESIEDHELHFSGQWRSLDKRYLFQA